MTQPPQPPNEPPQGGFGAPQDPPSGGFGAPQDPQQGGFGKAPEPGYGYPQAPGTPPPPPQGQPGQAPYGYPQAPQPPQVPQTPPPAAPPQTPPPAAPPQAPPAPPAYGRPAAPAYGQPAAPAYGQPAAPAYGQQPGYGYPGQPGAPGQQQYGYPQPPTVSMQPQPPGPGGPGGSNGKKKQMTIIVAAVAAIALIVGGGVIYAAQKGGDDKSNSAKKGDKDGKGGEGGDKKDLPSGGPAKEKAPADTSAKVAFQVPAPAVPKDDVWSVEGSWLTDDAVVKSGYQGKDKDHALIAYDPASGKQKWSVPLTGETCAVSKEITKDGIAAVVAKDAKATKANKYPDCSQVSAVNVKTGKKLWTKDVTNSGMKVEFEEITISGSTIAAGSGTGGTGAAWDLSGKLLWKPQIGDKCKDVGYAGGEQLVAVRKCGDYDDPKLKIQLIDPKSGDVKWSYALAAGIDNAKIISTSPVVFGQDTEEITASGATDVFSLSNNGKLRARIKLEDGKYSHDCDVNKVYSCRAIAVGNDKLYVPTRQHDAGGSGYGFTNEIIGFSLATGKTTGDRADAGKDGEMFPLRMDGGNVLAYKGGGYNKGAKVVSLDGKSMKETTLLETPATESVSSAISGMVPKSNEVLYGNGHLFMGKELISKPYSKDDKEYIALGFTTE
ncbi:outer membrane protein assembly factor BamB family protein [Streptomyces sp. AN091965]|uniref:outer membrane protein assembly factor BamB family protein n=1 Tax=Streptomyces sp. AN091965 TaxID=2927803 RepID=UPI002417C1AB|nr:PQQ-binding-like beta-propeller repeat protein [Streptomyces sp. AN091965]